LRKWSNEILHFHYIRGGRQVLCKTHTPSTGDWFRILYGKFIKIIPTKINLNTNQIFDHTRFMLHHQYRFKVGDMRQ